MFVSNRPAHVGKNRLMNIFYEYNLFWVKA